MRDLRVMGRNTQGVKLANLKEDDYLVAIQKLEGSENEEPFEEAKPEAEKAEGPDLNHAEQDELPADPVE